MRTRKTVWFFQIILAAIFQHQGIVAQTQNHTEIPSEKTQVNTPTPLGHNESEVFDIRKSKKAIQNSHNYLSAIRYFDDQISIIDNKLDQSNEMEEKVELQKEKTKLVNQKHEYKSGVRKQKQIPKTKQE